MLGNSTTSPAATWYSGVQQGSFSVDRHDRVLSPLECRLTDLGFRPRSSVARWEFPFSASFSSWLSITASKPFRRHNRSGIEIDLLIDIRHHSIRHQVLITSMGLDWMNWLIHEL
jgi:hypothetical protein